MKKSIIVLMILVFCSCSKEDESNESVTAESIEKTTNIQNFKKIADAFDNIDVKSKMSQKNQMIIFLDKEYSGDFKEQFNINQKNSVASKGNSDDNGIIDLEQKMATLNFSQLQKEYLNKTMVLYSNQEETKTTSVNETQAIDDIKAGLLIIRNEIATDSKLKDEEKEQMYLVIDLQYATVFSTFKYVERVQESSSITSKKFSFRKMINQTLSIVVGIVVGACLGTAGGPVGQVVGAVAGGAVVAYDVFHNNRCFKLFRGVGSCDTSFF